MKKIDFWLNGQPWPSGDGYVQGHARHNAWLIRFLYPLLRKAPKCITGKCDPGFRKKRDLGMNSSKR
ncbi:hypothetical protein [Rufibacter immobilis]|uniref:hypothetical protein n=1 Tax=Rufibacter immobilis TaxID=1348778 RepID=UPI0011CDBDA8|nr:hypothetical protein [Rufibacter immobilis]